MFSNDLLRAVAETDAAFATQLKCLKGWGDKMNAPLAMHLLCDREFQAAVRARDERAGLFLRVIGDVAQAADAGGLSEEERIKRSFLCELLLRRAVGERPWDRSRKGTRYVLGVPTATVVAFLSTLSGKREMDAHFDSHWRVLAQSFLENIFSASRAASLDNQTAEGLRTGIARGAALDDIKRDEGRGFGARTSDKLAYAQLTVAAADRVVPTGNELPAWKARFSFPWPERVLEWEKKQKTLGGRATRARATTVRDIEKSRVGRARNPLGC